MNALETRLKAPMLNTFRHIIATMRPPQWVKNVFVFAPVVFASRHTREEPFLLLYAAAATAVFILLAGAVYIFNDMLDADKDRQHPTKKNRPIASGRLAPRPAATGALVLLALSIGLGAWLGWQFLVAAVAYLVLNLVYSSGLKRVPWIDILIIASGFVLRILAGCFAIRLAPAEISYYLIGCTFLIASFLALAKRRHEASVIAGGGTRDVLRSYDMKHLDMAMIAVAGASVVAYSMYAFSERTSFYFGNERMPLTIPFVLFGIFEFIRILRRPGETRSPTDRMLRDPLFILNGVAYAAMVVFVVYG